MKLRCARAAGRDEGLWWPIDRIGEAGLPSLFAKLVARAIAWREGESETAR